MLAQHARFAPFTRAGKQSLLAVDRPRVREQRGRVSCSTALEECVRPGCFDYLLVVDHRRVLGLEVHPARASEVDCVLAKKLAASAAVRSVVTVVSWYWVASGEVARSFTRTTSEARRLATGGVEFPTRRLVV